MRTALLSRPARSRMINFRVSGEEFELLLESARESGCRTVSDYLRHVVLSPAASAPRTGELGADRMSNVLAELEGAIRAARQSMRT
jgi:hypothetical protein